MRAAITAALSTAILLGACAVDSSAPPAGTPTPAAQASSATAAAPEPAAAAATGDIPDGEYEDINFVASIGFDLGIGYDIIAVEGNTIKFHMSGHNRDTPMRFNDSPFSGNEEYTYEVAGDRLVVSGSFINEEASAELQERTGSPFSMVMMQSSITLPFELLDEYSFIILGATYERERKDEEEQAENQAG